MKSIAAVLLVVLTLPLPAQQQGDGTGQVQIPIEVYNQLVEASRDPTEPPRPAPASFALGRAQVNVTVKGGESRPTAEVRVDLAIRVLEDEWMGIPVLPAGTPVDSVVVGGSNVQLITSAHGLIWSVRKSGDYSMTLNYRVDAAVSEGGASLAVPVPQAAAIRFNATLPGTGLDVAVIPSAGTSASESGGQTRVQATVPTTRGVQLTWRTPSRRGHALSRASYSGTLSGSAVAWTGQLTVELFSDESLNLPLLPRGVTLSQIAVDGRDAAILVEGDRFATVVRGRGRHTVTVGFEVPVVQQDGPPHIQLQVPPVPVSRFDLTLPGKKEVTVTPASNVQHRTRGETTVASAFVPLSQSVSMTWSEAVPEAVRTEVRANASLYHAVHAEEGVIFVRAMLDYEVTRGETNTLVLEVPADVQVNRISSPAGAVADWRIAAPSGGVAEATVFFDRQVQGNLLVEVYYDRSLGAADSGPVSVPLLSAPDTHRQRGMVALLQSKDLTLKPVDEDDATRVGENQLPAFVRQAIEMTVAHTYKYVETPPALAVEVSVPERQQGRFDAQVDTLISLGDVSMKGSASVEANVKSGRIMELDLRLPENVNLLSLTGPSVRKHTPEAVDGAQRIKVEFTQEMEGQFRLEVAYERILADGESEFVVPTLAVDGAEVEQGRLAVEALSAVEVRPAQIEQLTPLDMSELPQQLILRTTNPILMAYKYVQAEPPHRLSLTVTRHEVLEVQEAAIDSATYRTLFTKDGLAVTTARFMVRNSRKQFLRIDLPSEAELWSAFVDGRPEKPAQAEDDDGSRTKKVLIKIIHSTEGFPVELIYKTPSSPIGGWLGSAVRGRLPHPDILVTHSRWDVYVPADVAYHEPTTNMELVNAGVPVQAEEMAVEAGLDERSGGTQVIEPLRLTVPTSGLHFAFEKLYANQSADEPAEFELPYASGVGTRTGWWMSLAGTALFWLALVALVLRERLAVKPRNALIAMGAGLAVAVFMIEYYHVSTMPSIVLSVVAVLALGGWFVRELLAERRAEAEDEI